MAYRQPTEPAELAELRCTLCGACCTRSGAHSLCSHGSFAHLWCRPQQRSGDDETRHGRFIVTVESDVNGICSSTRFSDDEAREKLSSIARQYGITVPDDFNRRWLDHSSTELIDWSYGAQPRINCGANWIELSNRLVPAADCISWLFNDRGSTQLSFLVLLSECK